jgi:hemerythrin-like domain-containing protein
VGFGWSEPQLELPTPNAIDFLGNFVHVCHRVKEELIQFPAMARNGVISTNFTEVIEKEHKRAKGMMLSLCRSYEEGDWEGVLRIPPLREYGWWS